ncbi:hypothetical protein B0G57_104313 [Trinickia symbiotica]|nr:hypothetical protein B0G57_104313 [Trinickia symbiotica]
MLELTTEQVAALAEIDAKRFVEGVRVDLCNDDPKLVDDATLSSRLWRAFKAARETASSAMKIWLRSSASKHTRRASTSSLRYAHG